LSLVGAALLVAASALVVAYAVSHHLPATSLPAPAPRSAPR
ncbi:MAG: hypothetical protein JWM10_174, partial [Myxococcaceae bacterium]|nr:hypothetical protein [Myxococcaceae bacterium]